MALTTDRASSSHHDRHIGCSSHAGLHPCLAAASALIDQAVWFIANLDDDIYARCCPSASDGTIGKHVRHCLDHFVATLDAADHARSPESVGRPVIDYDHRERDVPVERCRRAASDLMAAVRHRLSRLDAARLAAPVVVRVMVAQDGQTVDLPSTLAREIAFATHHALHHHAMMRFIAESFGLTTLADFGKAPSTINHERSGPAFEAGAAVSSVRS